MQACTAPRINEQDASCSTHPSFSFRKVLVALDFSKETDSVLRAALAIAPYFRSELLLFHAVTAEAELTCADPTAAQMIPVELEAARAQMDELVASEPLLSCYEHREILDYGRPVDVAQRLVQRFDRSFISGSHGTGGLSE